MTIGGDLLPHMKLALQEAWSQGLLLDSQDFADYKIGGMNMGWEMPGMNDASLQIRNYSVIATVDVPPSPPTSLVGLWEFENGGNLTKATIGSDLALSGFDTVVAGTGSATDTGAADVGPGSYYTVTNPIGENGGGTLTNEYTLLFDVSYPVAGIWHALFQTDPANSNDGEYFIHPGNDSWGVGDLSYTDGIPASVGEFYSSTDTWYRAVLSVDLGNFVRLYIEGNLEGEYSIANAGIDSRFALDTVLLALGDNDGEDGTMKLSNLALWDGALDADAVAALGEAGSGIVATPGDFNGDGDVDGADLTDPINGWEARFGDDLDGGDFLDWQRNFGTIPVPIAAAIAIPEPATDLLILVAVIGMILSRGR